MNRRSKTINNSKEEIKYLLEEYNIGKYVDIYLDFRRTLKIIIKLDYNVSDFDINLYAKDLYKLLSEIITNIYKIKTEERYLRLGTWEYLDELEEILLRDFFILSKKQHNRCEALQNYGENIIKLRNNLYIHRLMLDTNNLVPYMSYINIEIERAWGSYLIGNEKLIKLIKVAMNEYDRDEYGKMTIEDFDCIDKLVEKFENYSNCLINCTTGR